MITYILNLTNITFSVNVLGFSQYLYDRLSIGVIHPWGTAAKTRNIILTGLEGGRDAGSHHRSEQHVEGQDVLRVRGHVLELVLGGAGVQGQLPGSVPAHKL